MRQVILGLGSNVGDRQMMLSQAVVALRKSLGGLRISAVQENAALLPEGAPQAWNMPFLNMAVAAHTTQTPQELLAMSKRIEQQLGRHDRGRWGPREIDIDVLACGELVVNTPQLVVPHPELLNRAFALQPLAELAPEWVYPVMGEFHGRTAAELVTLLFTKAKKSRKPAPAES